MTILHILRTQWNKLPVVSSYYVVREILSHEIKTRKDIQDFFANHNLSKMTDKEIGTLAPHSPRGSLFNSIINGYGEWRLWIPKLELIQEIAICDTIHFRKKYAPKTGTLNEIAKTLIEEGELGEFTEIVKYLRDGKVDFRGLTAVWLKENEIELIEGCNRMIGMSFLLLNDEIDILPTKVRIYIGKPH